MKFSEVVAQTLAWLQREGRVSYRALKREFALDNEFLEDVKAEIIEAKRLAIDENGKVLVWVGNASVVSSQFPVASSSHPPALQTSDSGLRTPDSNPQTLDARRDAAERRQLTVMFCDLVGSTALSEQLDPEELREVVRAYHETCAGVISRYAGHTAQHLGDGLLVYFGYPAAHEDDTQRAVRTGLEILAELPQLNRQLQPTVGAHSCAPLQLPIGLHTGLVVVGEIGGGGGGGKRENLALGETPNIAARIQGLAEPDTVVISATTHRLVEGYFTYRDLGAQSLKGISAPMSVYQVLGESGVSDRFEVAVRGGLTPLIGREHEVGLLGERWEQAKQGAGQVVLLSGEAGIGKSRLVQALKERIVTEQHTRLECRCSPYHQNSALYPVIDLLQRVLGFTREDSPAEKLAKLETALVGAQHAAPLPPDTVPLFAALLSLPLSERYPPLTLTPQKQKEKTQQAIVTWLLKEAERQALLSAWEDLHWADPSTLELLDLLIAQAPTARMYLLLTFRPEFTPPWASRSHLTSLTLSRLPRTQAEVMVTQVTGGKALPPEVSQQIVAKTDGVPLFVEELTKMVVESGLYVGAQHAAPLPPLGIPATLHDALMARLDRLGPGKEVAQLGATLGREFSYELLQAVSSIFSWDEVTLQRELARLVDAEFLFQRGLPPQARYVFKHALIQDAAYQSLLKSTRQQYHQQIAQVLAERFSETAETQPELLAYHYTEAGLIAQAIPYWQQAGQRAAQHSANVEAIVHLTKGLELLKTLPDTPERAQQELTLQIALGVSLQAGKGWAASETGKAYTRARELSRQVGETPQLFSVLMGLWGFYVVRAELKTTRELAEQLFSLVQNVRSPTRLLWAHNTLGKTLFFLGEFALAREHSEQGIALYDPQKRPSLHVLQDPEVDCLSYTAWALWYLGYANQALKKSHKALTLAQETAQPFNLAYTLDYATQLHVHRREGQAAQERAEALIALSSEQGFPFHSAVGTIYRGWALVEQGQKEEGIAQMRQGLATHRAIETELARPYFLALLAGAYGKVGQAEGGLALLAEALAIVHKNGERFYEAELYRLKGQLTLQKFQVSSFKFQVSNTQDSAPSPQAEAEAEACFLKAIEIARKQQAKSLELRAVMSLSRLWQQQGKKKEAHEILAEIYGWFTEGFDTKDLQEAKALLDSLGSSV